MTLSVLTMGDSAVGHVTDFLNSQNTSAQVIGCVEDFSCGPLPGLEDMAAFAQARSGFWKTIIPEDEATKRHWRKFLSYKVAKLRGAQRIEIWVGQTVREQFFLLVCLGLLARHDFPKDRIFFRQFHQFRNIPALFMLRPEEFAPLPDAQAFPDWLTDALGALTSGTARDMDELVARGSGHAPLDQALALCLARRPDPETGLGSIEHRLILAATAEHRPAARTVGEAMAAQGDPRDDLGDLVLWHRLRQMPDWVEIIDKGAITGSWMRGFTAALTEDGQRVQQQLRSQSAT